MEKIFYCLIFVCTVVSCTNSKKNPDVSNINVSVSVVRFDKDIFSAADIAFLSEKYGSFFYNFCDEILGIGTPDNAEFKNLFNIFRNDSIVLLAQHKASQLLDTYETTLNNELTQAFKLYKYYFPEKKIPQIYIYTSGFNHSIIIDENIIGIGMDKFLGSDEEIYKSLGFSKYLVQNMRKELIASAVINALAVDQFPLENLHYSLIEKMIYEGKKLYFNQQLLPHQSENDLLGFTPENMKFCKNNEKQMWTYLIENKLLYSNNYTVITKFTEDAPYTYDFSQDSPGKAVHWLGFRIVQQYVDNTNTNLTTLMTETNYEKILRDAKYNPKD